MRNQLAALSFALLAFSLYANDEDLFADIDSGMEVDANFEDDFAGLEEGNTGKAVGSGTTLSHPYEAFAERSLMRKENSLGGSLSQETIRRVFYLNLFPQARFKVWEINGHVGLPLRFPIYDNVLAGSEGNRRRGFSDIEEFITPRHPDFRNFSDAFKIIRSLDLGEIRDPYFLGFGRERAITLGQGELMREMVSDYLYDQDYLFAQGHADFDFMRIEGMFGPIPKVNLLGLNAQVSPLAGLNIHPFVKDIGVNLSYVADYMAPGEVKREEGAYLLDDDRRLVKRDWGTAQALSLGVASEYKPVSWYGSKPYTSFSQLWLTNLREENQSWPYSYGTGFNLGHDATFYFSGNKTGSQLFLRAEGRFFSKYYEPNYFGGNYMLDRVSLLEDSDDLVSKSSYVGIASDGPLRFGHMFELGYAYDNIFNTKLSYENARILKDNIPIKPLRKLRFTTGLMAFDMVKLQGSYEANSIDNLKEIFDLKKSRGHLSLRGQVKLLSFLYFDSWIKHSFGIGEMYQASGDKTLWLSSRGERRSLNYGLGLEFAMAL